MALTPTVVPKYPTVPIAPGVPQVKRAPNASPVLGVVALASDAISILHMFQGPQWGLFPNGTTSSGFILPFSNFGASDGAIVGDSCYAVEFVRDMRISQYPVEGATAGQGSGFGSFNKVFVPFIGKITFTVGGSLGISDIVATFTAGSISGALDALTGQSARHEFLAKVDAAVTSLQLYSMVTPDYTYPSVNLTHYDYRRTREDGATMLTVDIWVEQVSVTGKTTYSNTASPAGANPVNGGIVQSEPLPPLPGSNVSNPDGTVTHVPAAPT